MSIEEFLAKELISNDFLFVDNWSFVHFSSGIILMIFIYKYFYKKSFIYKFSVLFFIIVLWEIFEYNFPFTYPEKKIDIFYDLVVGMLAGFCVYYLKK